LIVSLWSSTRADEPTVIGFDAPAIVVAVPVNPAVVEAPTMGGQLLRLRLPVSTYISPQFRGEVTEYVVEIESPTQSMRVVDFWPKNEVYSDIDGTVAVARSQQKDVDFAFNVAGAYEPFGRGTASGNYHNTLNHQESYQRKPPMQVLTSSGTIHRGYGVFFKFRPGPAPLLEGAREVALLVEVPQGWRADMLRVTMRAAGRSSASGSARTQPLAETQLWTTTHREGDSAAATQAKRYVTQERKLRALAASSSEQIVNRSLPTLWHKLGASLEIVEPRIPADYLSRIIFGAANQRFEGGKERLPVDLRVAALDYWEERHRLMSLATATTPAQHVVAKQHIADIEH
jgi:hypothetical protein